MHCILPDWMNSTFQWFMEGKITEQTLRDATEWLIIKGIIACNIANV